MFRAGFSRKLVSGEAVDDVVFTLFLMNLKLLICTVPIQYIFLQDTTGITVIYSKVLLSTLELFSQPESINLTGYWYFNTS